MPFLYNSLPPSGNQYTIATNGLMVYVDATKSSSYPGTGTTWYDLSGNSNNMTISNCSYDGSKSFLFNGSTSYTYTPNMYPLLTTSNSVVSQTQEIWFKSSNAGVLVNETNSVTTPSWYDSQIELTTPTIVKGRYWNFVSPYVTLGTNDSSKWNYAVIRYNGSTAIIDGFFNGTFTSTISFTRQFAPSPALYYVLLGKDSGTNMGSGLNFNGNIAIYRSYKRALSNTEILNNYNAQKGIFGL